MKDGVYAILPGGGEVRLAARHGSTIQAVYKSLGALTGSASPVREAELELEDGTKIPFGRVVRFEEHQSFV